MRALVLSRGSLELQDVPLPNQPGECRIRVLLAGICGTDLQLVDGYAGFEGIPGHEFVGVVEDAPAGDRGWIGKRVVGEINVGCGRCALCRAGVKEHCPERTVIGIRGRSGAFAEFVSLPAANLHEVPDTLDDRAAVFVEPVAAACRILEQVALERGTRVAIVGDGRLGLLIAQVLRTVSYQVTVIGRHAAKLAVAEQLGIPTFREHVAGDLSTAGALADAGSPAIYTGDQFDVVVDATGRKEGLARALDLVRPRGRIVLKSTFHGEASAELWPAVVHEVTMIGSRCGPFLRALDVLQSGAVRTDALLSGVFPLDAFQNAFAAARDELKVLISV